MYPLSREVFTQAAIVNGAPLAKCSTFEELSSTKSVFPLSCKAVPRTPGTHWQPCSVASRRCGPESKALLPLPSSKDQEARSPGSAEPCSTAGAGGFGWFPIGGTGLPFATGPAGSPSPPADENPAVPAISATVTVPIIVTSPSAIMSKHCG